MIDDEVFDIVRAELARARKLHPHWTTDPLVALAMLQEGVGALTKAVLRNYYLPGKNMTAPSIHAEGVRVAAMAIRFLANFDKYAFVKANEILDGDNDVQL